MLCNMQKGIEMHARFLLKGKACTARSKRPVQASDELSKEKSLLLLGAVENVFAQWGRIKSGHNLEKEH